MAQGEDRAVRPTGSEIEFEARVGTSLRRKWKLERLIGIGGMAAVYEARHKIGRVAAIKVLRPEIAVDARLLDRFEQEAMAVNAVGHPGVVQVLDIDEDPAAGHFLVMELLHGETLADRFDHEGSLKVPALLDYVDQTLDVLVACHQKGIIHRDIKPENLFIQKNGKVKVLDFGIARMREGVKTVAGTMLGTVAFMPPEQLRGVAVDARADLYALGATMFTVISGRRVHQGPGDMQLAAQVLSKPAPALASVAKDAPEHLGWVVDRALAFLPERRYPDARTMRGDVWALQRNERPPYAYACNEAGQRPDVTKLEADPAKKTRPEGVALPSTDPQMPVFAAVPTTDPQMPAFAVSPKSAEPPEIELEPTRPERPVLDASSVPPASEGPTSAPASSDAAPASAEDRTEERAEDSFADAPSEPPDSDLAPASAPSSGEGVSREGSSREPTSEPPDSDVAPSEPSRRAAPAAGAAKGSRTIVGFPRRGPAAPSDEPDDEPLVSDDGLGDDDLGDEQPESAGDEAAEESPSSEPKAAVDDEISHDAASVPPTKASPRAPRSKAWWVGALVVIVAAASAAGAYFGGLLP